ncbi:isoaspartyl peptidase/L-asparaginase family protein [Sabulicella glaciei]|uniref:Isoaspartyl peptidase/L-asparaginase n=1 Tax=Sabulicella glaciei TaxID=2984948 RepID=A0ABT3NUI7_9PROT|nr:isoaspartyl peptidase/L-asparaginase [Roseococcus sp. MDT2-1-1]MCW8085822.1 isoaspartyl peptidase/L-asparaginase [Roseococcus sp. MDT2-1-1]
MGWTIAIHGGAGTIARAEMNAGQEAAHRDALHAALEAGAAVLREGGAAEEAVLAAVSSMEDCPLFNAGHGATLTAAGHAELDAALMLDDGRAGAVTGARRIRNPVRAAQAVMRHTKHVLLQGEAADGLAAECGLPLAESGYFVTPHRLAQLEAARRDGELVLDHDGRMGTVGAVARDAIGALAAATSTGGMTNKRPGRVGDSPVIGAGTWADGRVAVSCTGTGEAFLRCAAAHEVAARMRLAGEDLGAATRFVVEQAVPEAGGSGGLIAVDAAGHFALPFNTSGMYRGVWRDGDAPEVAIFRD